MSFQTIISLPWLVIMVTKTIAVQLALKVSRMHLKNRVCHFVSSHTACILLEPDKIHAKQEEFN